ncbi:hypothetical protein [Nitrosospira sp. NpAV]|uniref:hypothetical protein n=1 Tax=Nitrosospira sp. NpAV TaxID=58133 RepID=UPI00059FBF64|nr:hypothetical protein [Nitrosospira sp. NpAV]KIO48699.1 hypothetical protein SQ11_10535 [Nitrosospira sp. NpAV]
MLNDDKRLTGIADMEKARKQRRLTNTFRHLLDEARAGNVKCFASRLYYKDGTSELVVVGGTLEEQAVIRAKLEAMEAEVNALMAECRPLAAEVFAHLPEEEWRQVLDSPERMRLALNTLPDNQRTKLNPLLERLTKHQTFIEGLLPPAHE